MPAAATASRQRAASPAITGVQLRETSLRRGVPPRWRWSWPGSREVTRPRARSIPLLIPGGRGPAAPRRDPASTPNPTNAGPSPELMLKIRHRFRLGNPLEAAHTLAPTEGAMTTRSISRTRPLAPESRPGSPSHESGRAGSLYALVRASDRRLTSPSGRAVGPADRDQRPEFQTPQRRGSDRSRRVLSAPMTAENRVLNRLNPVLRARQRETGVN